MIERYSLPEMAAVWTLESRYAAWLEVEIAACEAWAELGVIPREDAQMIRERARVDVRRALEIERETRHDVVAFTRAVSETLGAERKWVHYGLTSTDVVDTAQGVQLKRANELIFAQLRALIATLREQAVRYKDTVMMGRTHGVHAEPTTFGLKLALYHAELERQLDRFTHAAEGVRYGKLSGAVGTYANIDPRVEELVCARLGLKPAPISTQTLQRDRHAEFVSALALIGATLEKIATEIRGLQKTEIREVEEPFYAGQKGSSAMPHKRNPVNCEQIAGLERVLRGNMVAAHEDVALWHERDISHSSVERVILPDSTILAHYLLAKMSGIIANLHVYPENMLRNMDRSLGLIFSQRVLLALVERGLSREEAYDTVQAKAMQAWREQRPFRELVEAELAIRGRLTAAELDDCFDVRFHVRRVDEIFVRLGLLDAPERDAEDAGADAEGEGAKGAERVGVEGTGATISGGHPESDNMTGGRPESGGISGGATGGISGDTSFGASARAGLPDPGDGAKGGAPIPERGAMVYEGKAKRVYETVDPDLYLVEFKDDATAFNGKKRGAIARKGEINNRVSSLLFAELARHGVRSHFVAQPSAREMLVRRVRIVPLEVVVRNIAAGGLAQRIGWEEGREMPQPVVEFYYKNDALGDPLVNRMHALVLGLATDGQMDELERQALRINVLLRGHLLRRGLLLVDFKLEFGVRPDGAIVLADEISPDTCRLWDSETRDRLDKDRFRRDLGRVEQAYNEVLRRVETDLA